jgi:hypothetical protein
MGINNTITAHRLIPIHNANRAGSIRPEFATYLISSFPYKEISCRRSLKSLREVQLLLDGLPLSSLSFYLQQGPNSGFISKLRNENWRAKKD